MNLWASMIVVMLAAPTSDRGARGLSFQPEDAGRWSIHWGNHIAPFEQYPHYAPATGAAVHLGRFRLGGEGVVYLPDSYGNIRRFAALVNAQAQLVMLDSRFVDWTAQLGIGLAIFHDDYRTVFDDRTRAAPGFTLGTALEFRASERLRPYVGFRSVAYFARPIADDKWLEFTVGLRLVWPRSRRTAPGRGAARRSHAPTIRRRTSMRTPRPRHRRRFAGARSRPRSRPSGGRHARVTK